MPTARYRLLRLVGVLAFVFMLGCAMTREIDTPPILQSSDPSCEVPAEKQKASRPVSAIVLASGEGPATPLAIKELSEETLVQEVLQRNPTVAQMTAAVEAAAARVPQATDLDDPKVGATVGPASIGSRSVDFAYRIEVSQAFPFPGKRALRGDSARGEAAATAAELDDARVALAEAARLAFADYGVAFRATEINQESIKLLGELRENAVTRYRTGVGEQQDILQAEVAIARQRERASSLERARRVAQARINTLLNLPPDAVLAPPPKEFAKATPLPDARELRETALQNRPDIAALRARATADEAAVALANKEYYPDVEVMAAYDAFWQSPERDLRPMVGVRMNLPVRMGRRDGALAEAQARLTQRRAELARLTAQVGLQVQEAYEQVKETERSLALYEETALPAARKNVDLARTAYTNGKVPFSNLIEAQKNLVELRDREIELLADAHRRRAAPDRAVGTASITGEIPPVRLR